jgi:hypothetical protein
MDAWRGPTPRRGFDHLARLLDHDEAGLRRILAVFHHCTVRDLLDLEHAAARGDWDHVRRMAGRLAIGCIQVGERHAAGAFVVFGGAHSDVAVRAAYLNVYSGHRWRVLEVIERAAKFADAAPQGEPVPGGDHEAR